MSCFTYLYATPGVVINPGDPVSKGLSGHVHGAGWVGSAGRHGEHDAVVLSDTVIPLTHVKKWEVTLQAFPYNTRALLSGLLSAGVELGKRVCVMCVWCVCDVCMMYVCGVCDVCVCV